ncbi:hypothetical protein EUX98_g3021 [Antrodiella citrinella]|uniref:Uncharacterized protein n=1 Tax=Antrodiella citrinella TaxID=2447956 RepID=A0A4S4MXK7_9APHY|nr:hypothetical protein EUX98_g3021 [Antrodiella citrinella]
MASSESYCEITVHQDRSTIVPENLSDVALQFTVVETLKLVFSLAYYLWKRPQLAVASARRGIVEGDDEEGHPLNHVNGFYEHTPDRSLVVQSSPRWHPMQAHSGARIPRYVSIGMVVVLAALLAHANYIHSIAEHFYGPFSTGFALSISTLFTLAWLFSFFIWVIELPQYQAVFTQICGFLVIQAGLTTVAASQTPYITLLDLSFSVSLTLALITCIYRTPHNISLEALHTLLFAASLFINLVLLGIHNAEVLATPHDRFSFWVFLQCVGQVALDLTGLLVIYAMDAPTLGVLASLGAAIHFLSISFTTGVFSGYVAVGCLIVIIASVSYFIYRKDDEENYLTLKAGHGMAFITQVLSAAFLLIVGVHIVIASSSENALVLRYADVKPAKITDLISDSLVTCRRKPLLSTSWYPHERSYHAFDDVLLIVFFSHARYDVNLESYREVYSEFFPNIVLVGPRSREDAGFNHSYDVLVDSYEAEEDLHDPDFYKMAGRMAHHMLYTALDAYPCYDGYLWAPFDTMLNIPRLQQFNQNLFWYHSPFGTYVHNPALGDAAANANKSRHAPPANISPDPALNLTATWKGWQTDWWWGDPHVGLEVCMQAFRRVPLAMRENLAALTNGTTRLIGGSADTLYIPGRHREVFKETLGTFLETMCFLEIATPTVVHLVAPPEEPIQFVDHWWIWQPPFNASFVRQKWDEGFEVDTFHTFHWGDLEADGVWRGNPAHKPDVRKLLAQSAARQNVDFRLRLPNEQ